MSSSSGRLSSPAGGSSRPRWSPAGSPAAYRLAEVNVLAPVRQAIEARSAPPESFDIFLCHAWDDRKGAASELQQALADVGVTVWFSEKSLVLGTPMLREIDKGLVKSRAGIVLVTPEFLKRLAAEGVAEKELAALLSRDLLIPVVHGTTYEALLGASPLLASRAGMSTQYDTFDQMANKVAELLDLTTAVT